MIVRLSLSPPKEEKLFTTTSVARVVDLIVVIPLDADDNGVYR